jgi:enoyl-CoA hydratase/carnithine racemase
MMQFTEIDYDVADGVATITLSRPDKLNVYTHTMAREWSPPVTSPMRTPRSGRWS